MARVNGCRRSPNPPARMIAFISSPRFVVRSINEYILHSETSSVGPDPILITSARRCRRRACDRQATHTLIAPGLDLDTVDSPIRAAEGGSDWAVSGAQTVDEQCRRTPCKLGQLCDHENDAAWARVASDDANTHAPFSSAGSQSSSRLAMWRTVTMLCS